MLSKKLFCALVVGAAIGATAAPAAAATTMMTTGTVQVWVTLTSTSGATSDIVVTGVIGDYGTATSVTKSGAVNPNGNYEKITLKKGGFTANSTVLNQKTNNSPPIMQNATTCSVVFGGTGPVTLLDGTGAYAGITGTIQITQKFAGIGARFTSGAKKGQCNMSNNSEPVAFYGSITGVGKVSFG